MKSFSSALVFLFLLAYHAIIQVHGDNRYTCTSRRSPCFLKRLTCPKECPSTRPANSKAKACFVDCNSPICKPVCKHMKPNCYGPGAACLDPRFIGGDGIVFYFHGKRDEHFALVSDKTLQINARFIGLRPEGRKRDFTWIQAIGLLFNKHDAFTVEATKSEKWDQRLDHLIFTFNGREIDVPARYPSTWEAVSSSENLESKQITVERTSEANSVLITVPEVAEISINVVPITEEDNRIHNYRIPSDDCFAHLEVQFRFYGLSDKVEGVLGKTYRPDFVNPAKPGVAMPVVGGEDKYKTSSLVDVDCKNCVFSPYEEGDDDQENDAATVLAESVESKIDCTGKWNSGNGIVCRK